MTTQNVGAPLLSRPTVWSVVRDAVRGVPHDDTSGSIGRAVVLLAIPMVLEVGMESLGYSTLALASAVLFCRGQWKLRQV